MTERVTVPRWLRLLRARVVAAGKHAAYVQDIARRESLAPETVATWLTDAGMTAKWRTGETYPHALRVEAVARVVGGEIVSLVAREMDLSRSTVTRWVEDDT